MSPSPMAWSGAWLEALVSPALALDPDGHVLDLNGSARRLLQAAVPGGELGSQSFEAALAPASRPVFGRVLARAAEGERWGGSLRLRRGSGEHLVRARVSPVRADGVFVGTLLTLDNSTDADPSHLVERMTRLARAGAELQSTDDLERLTEIIVTQLADAAGATSASVSLRVDDDRLAMVGLRGGSSETSHRWAAFPSAGTPAGDALEAREPLFFADRQAFLARYPALTQDVRDAGSVLILPLLLGRRGVGVVSLSFPAFRRIDTTELDFYKVLADSCAQALERIRALDKVAEQNAKLRFLAEASAELARSLDYEQTLAQVAQLAVPGFADWCAISLEQDGVLRTLAVAHRDPAKVDLALQLQQRYPADPDAPGGAYEVLRTGEPLLVPEISDELLAASAVDEEHLALIRRLELRSGLTVALKARGRTFGTLTWVNGHAGRRFDSSDIAFGEDLARRAAVAIDNAYLHSELRTIAGRLQSAVAPEALPKLEGWELAAAYTSAGRVDVGGDFYDFTELPDGRLAVVIGDVMGRGVDAAAAMSQVRAALRALVAVDPDPAVLLSRLDLLFERHPTEQLVTLAYAVADPERDELVVSSAGHPAPLLRAADGRLEYVEGGRGTILGVGRTDREVQRIRFSIGDTLFLFTDGLLERRDEDYEEGRERLRRAARALPSSISSPDLETLVEEMRDPTRDDDVAVVTLRRV